MSDVATLTNEELETRIGAAVLDNPEQAVALEAERQRRATAAEHERLAERERQRRAEATNTAARQALYELLTAELLRYSQEYTDALMALRTTPPIDWGPLIAAAYIAGRQAYSLSHDLFAVTAERRFHRPYRVPDAIRFHGGATGESYLRSIAGRPPVIDTPWRADLDRLRQLSPRTSRIGNGG